MKTRVRGLAELGRLFRIETQYRDMRDERVTADVEAVLLVLRALGAELRDDDDAEYAVRARRAQLDRLVLQQVHVAWNGSLRRLQLRLPNARPVPVSIELRLESGEVRVLKAVAEPTAVRTRHAWLPTHSVPLALRLPLGYHVITIETSSSTLESFIIAAPRHAFVPEDAREWGVFLPLHALRSGRNWGVGDYTELEQIARWTGSMGGQFVATLPLLATFLDAPFEPSPYSPVSKLFWNELFLDITSVPGWAADQHADFPVEFDASRAGDFVAYRRIAALKRRELTRALHACGTDPHVLDGMRHYTGSHVYAADYARFRAVCDRRRIRWASWPEGLRDGIITAADFAPDDYAYHVFAQWQTDQQLARVDAARAARAAELYLDMPLGVNPDGFDAWRFRELFAADVAAGAPPDPLFTGGQNWGFRPLHPGALRAQRYSYFIETLRHHFRHARMLRLDHVMSLYRLFWVPDGLPATRGVYVRYPEDELFAILVLESARHRSIVIGEDLGTVPHVVRRNMDRHRIQRMHVVQFEASPDAPQPLPPAPKPVVASLNTHDMPTFMGFWKGLDIDDQLDLGLVDETEHVRAHRLRKQLCRRLGQLVHADGSASVRDVRDGLLARLAASEARYVLATLEDLWLEERPQNVPGTSHERPNWQRRARRTFDEMTSDPEVLRVLQSIDALRHAPISNGTHNG